MLAIIKTIDGVKKIVKVTADAGAGNPVGTIIPMYKKSSPSGYLYCDGSTFDATAYPLLYAYLGSNVLPDFREFALVGAEENTTSSNIAVHDIYTEGQEKDDQLQDHTHDMYNTNPAGSTPPSPIEFTVSVGSTGFPQNIVGYIKQGRTGTVTRGKRKAVYFYIKATSGLSENAQDNVINTLNEQRSYSTEEHPTGKKWIDGKPIYRIVLVQSGQITTNTAYFATEMANLNIDTITLKYAKAKILSGGAVIRNNMTEYYANASDYFSVSVGEINAMPLFSGNVLSDLEVTLEYTKTNG